MKTNLYKKYHKAEIYLEKNPNKNNNTGLDPEIRFYRINYNDKSEYFISHKNSFWGNFH